MGVRDYNREAWDREVDRQNVWTVPVGSDVIAAARRGRWGILLTDTKPVPRAWFPSLEGADVLCLASGGGQQAPILAMAGANVTVLDNSQRQLTQDRLVAEREGLALETVEGDMADLSVFPDASFDLVFHPVSNLFVPEVRPVWAEAFRVLRRGGLPVGRVPEPGGLYLRFGVGGQQRRGAGEVRAALRRRDEQERRRGADADRAGRAARVQPHAGGSDRGQIDAGFVIAGFYEDRHRDDLIAAHMPTLIATRAIKQ